MCTSTGVPITRVLPSDMFNPKYKLPAAYKNFYTRRTYYYGFAKYTLLVSLVGAFLTTSTWEYKDIFNARPDYNQMRIMTDNLPDSERKVFEMYGNTYFGQDFEDQPQSWLRKLKQWAFPSIDYNPHSSYYLPFYDNKRGFYPEDASSYYSN